MTEVNSLPSLNMPKMEADAVAWVTTKLGVAYDQGDSSGLARDAARLAAREEVAAAAARVERDRAVYTLQSGEYPNISYSDLAGALGLQSRARLTVIHQQMQALEEEGKFTPHPDPVAALPKLAATTQRHTTRAAAARAIRDQAVRLLLCDEGQTNAYVAKLIGTNPSRVSHMKKKMLGLTEEAVA